ncbi:MAG TPA: hypothetical protein VL475_15435 [Planctomycetaceae bacterium]|nr:hypothetical protein [Planctomycetaceae bacterium]
MWRNALVASAPAEGTEPERILTSVFALDSSSDGRTVVACLRGDAAVMSPLLIRRDNGPTLRIPAAESLITNSLFFKAAMFPAGESLLVAAFPSGVSRLDLDSGESRLLRSLAGPAAPTALAIAPDGRMFALAQQDQVLLCDTADGTERTLLQLPNGDVTDIDFSSGGTLMGTARGNGEIVLWSTESGAPTQVLRWAERSPSPPITRIRLVEAGRRLAAVGLDGAFRLWDTRTGEVVWSKPSHGHGLRALAVSPDGLVAAVGGDDCLIRIYDLVSVRERHVLDEHTKAIMSLRFVAERSLLISASNDGTILFWDGAADFSLVDCIEIDRPTR